jgi:hypothetical protein
MKYTIKASGLYDGGNDRWMENKNQYGEWAIAYHGTPYHNISFLLKSPLRVGECNYYGEGIYISPDFETAEGYCKDPFTVQTMNGSRSFKFILMVRVNPRSIHQCTSIHCPEAKNSSYSLHFTRDKSIWFANGQNSNYQNVRVTGIIVKNA